MTTPKPTDFWAIVEGRAAPPASAQLVGWRFAGFDEATGVLSCTFEATEAFLNPVGFVQGGMLAAMLDEAMGPVAAAVGRDDSLLSQTLEMKISYMRAAKPGTIRGEGRIVQRGREIIFLEGRLFDAEGRTIAAATATARAHRAAT
jgi:uncharacterized protein (TIGR00369 family)